MSFISQDSIQALAEFVTSSQFIWIYITTVFLIFIGSISSFFWKTIPLAKSLKKTVSGLERATTMAEFASEFPEIDEALTANELLKHPWREFKETLLFPGAELAFDVEEIHNTHPAAVFFSQESMVAPKLNLRFFYGCSF